MDGIEYLNIVRPLIEPLKQFENLYDSMEQIKKQDSIRKSSISKEYTIMSILIPGAFWLLYVIINRSAFFRSSWIRFVGIIVYALSVVVFAIYFNKVKEKRISEVQEDTDQKISIIDSDLRKMAESFYPTLQAYVPQNYQNSFALEYICSYLYNGRASNLQGAMNLYEEEMHRMRMENAQQQLLNQAKYQTALSAISAAANVGTAFSASSAASSLENISDRY